MNDKYLTEIVAKLEEVYNNEETGDEVTVLEGYTKSHRIEVACLDSHKLQKVKEIMKPYPHKRAWGWSTVILIVKIPQN